MNNEKSDSFSSIENILKEDPKLWKFNAKRSEQGISGTEFKNSFRFYVFILLQILDILFLRII